MAVTLKVKNIDRLTEALAGGFSAPVVRFLVTVSGEASRYAWIWEWGRVGINPGPKTTWGTNPDGQLRVMTITAPSGFIRVNRWRYKQIIREEVGNVRWSQVKPSGVNKAVQAALERAAKRCADLVSETAPIDTGALREAIKVIGPVQAEQVTTDTVGLRPKLKWG